MQLWTYGVCIGCLIAQLSLGHSSSGEIWVIFVVRAEDCRKAKEGPSAQMGRPERLPGNLSIRAETWRNKTSKKSRCLFASNGNEQWCILPKSDLIKDNWVIQQRVERSEEWCSILSFQDWLAEERVMASGKSPRPCVPHWGHSHPGGRCFCHQPRLHLQVGDWTRDPWGGS